VYSHAYFSLKAWKLIEDGHNGGGNMPPRTFGSGGSRLMKLIDGSHHGAAPSDRERLHIRLWLDSGAHYAGTYGAAQIGIIGGLTSHVGCTSTTLNDDGGWPTTVAARTAFDRRCASCHAGSASVLPRNLADTLKMGLPANSWVE
jgi:hypothetical protein